jgi:hypothetical protein
MLILTTLLLLASLHHRTITSHRPTVNPALVSRQFRALPKSRIESLLASFPALIPPGSQHTTVESQDGSVRFVYQVVEEVVIVVVTNRGSNILQVSWTTSGRRAERGVRRERREGRVVVRRGASLNERDELEGGMTDSFVIRAKRDQDSRCSENTLVS